MFTFFLKFYTGVWVRAWPGGCGGSVIVKGGVSKAQEQMNVKMNIVC